MLETHFQHCDLDIESYYQEAQDQKTGCHCLECPQWIYDPWVIHTSNAPCIYANDRLTFCPECFTRIMKWLTFEQVLLAAGATE